MDPVAPTRVASSELKRDTDALELPARGRSADPRDAGESGSFDSNVALTWRSVGRPEERGGASPKYRADRPAAKRLRCRPTGEQTGRSEVGSADPAGTTRADSKKAMTVKTRPLDPYPHLTRRTAGLLASGKRAKLAWVNRRRVYDYPERRKALRALHDALYRRREGELPPAVVLTGNPGNGKTFILEDMFHKHGQKYNNDAMMSTAAPMVWPEMPVATSATQLAIMILERFHGGLLPDYEDHPVDRAIAFLKHHCRTELLILDELWGKPEREITDYVDRIRREAGTGVVYTDSGDEEKRRAWMKTIPDVVHVDLPAWTPGRRLERLLRTVEAETPLPKPSGLAEPETMRRIAAAGRHTIGGIFEIVRTISAFAILDESESMRTDDIENLHLRPQRDVEDEEGAPPATSR